MNRSFETGDGFGFDPDRTDGGGDDVVVDLAAARAGVLPLCPDATPPLDDAAVTAGRGSRMAEELAVLADQMADTIALQDRVLAGVVPGTAEAGERVRTAQKVAARVTRTLTLIRDQLGEQHVELHELAEQLDQLLPGTAHPVDPTGPAGPAGPVSEAGWAA